MALNFSVLTHSLYTFEGKKPYEKVLILLYRHWFVLASKAVVFALMAFLPPVFYLVSGSYIVQWGLFEIFLFVASLYYLFWWYSLFYATTMYLLDTWVVSDHRIIDSEQKGFFVRRVSELNLAKIQDISVIVKGTIATFLDFGNLEIQTAGTEAKFIFKQIPHPKRVKDLIMQAHNEYVSTHREGIEVHETSDHL